MLPHRKLVLALAVVSFAAFAGAQTTPAEGKVQKPRAAGAPTNPGAKSLQAKAAKKDDEHDHVRRFAPAAKANAMAEADLTRRLLKNPADVKALMERGSVRLKMGRRDEAYSDFKKAVKLTPANADAHANLGYAYF